MVLNLTETVTKYNNHLGKEKLVYYMKKENYVDCNLLYIDKGISITDDNVCVLFTASKDDKQKITELELFKAKRNADNAYIFYEKNKSISVPPFMYYMFDKDFRYL